MRVKGRTSYAGLPLVPEGHEVELILRSQDVTHSFFVPRAAIEAGCRAGMEIHIHFTANAPGDYELVVRGTSAAGTLPNAQHAHRDVRSRL